MPWYNAFGIGRRSSPPPPPPAPVAEAVTAAAAPVKGPQSQFLQHTQEWQSEAWSHYDGLGEFNSGAVWLANMLSRVRLRAARLDPGLDEPTVVDSGLAAEIMGSLAGGVGGQSNIMRNIALQLTVPGDCYLVGEGDIGSENWTVRSVDEVRAYNNKFQVVTDRVPNVEWTDLPSNALPVRIWRPHARFYHLADSTSRAALPIMRELELVNRHITSQYLSRLASAGVLVLPDEVTFPVREEFEEAPDPFTAEWIEIAAEAIRTPGTASAVIPIPIKVPSEYVDKIRHIDFTLKIDEKVIEKRESAISRLANKLDIPAEVLTGLGNVNHWTAWQLDEGALKTHIAPTAEIICDSLTRGYLQPRLKASGEDPAKWVVWYDMSELAVRPDRSTNAFEAYDRLELSGAALRREAGFDEADAPSNDELKDQALKVIIHTLPSGAMSALAQLIDDPSLQPIVPVAPQAPDVAEKTQQGDTPESAPAEANGAKPEGSPSQAPGSPQTGSQPGPPGSGEQGDEPEKAAARAEKIMAQIKALHAVQFSSVKPGVLLHPPLCQDHAYSCPYTHAAWNELPAQLSSGTYECRLDPFGRFIVGRSAPELDTRDWIPTIGFIRTRKGQGHGR